MLLFSVLFVVVFLLASILRGCLVGLFSPGCSPCSLSFSGWCAGACVLRRYLLRLALFVLVCPVFLGLYAFFVVSLWCGFVLAFGCCCCCLFLGCLARLCFGCVGCFGLARSLLASFSPVLPAPSVGPLVPSGPQCSACPSLWVSGCVCDGSVVMPVAWCVVTASLFTPHGNKGLVLCFWSALPVLMLFWWAVPDVSLLRPRTAGPNIPYTSATVTSSLPSHLEVGLSLNSFVVLFVLAVLLPRPSGTSVLFCEGSRI